jgi:dienelactone hydrolase
MRLLIGLLLSSALAAQAPEQDARNVRVPNTQTHFWARDYSSRQAWEERKTKLRRQILFAAGLEPMPARNELRPQIFGRLERQGYSIEKVYLETWPGFYLGGNLYRPLGRTGPFPAVAKPHGHWSYGRLEEQPLASAHTLAANMARQGYVVFSYDMLGYNDTRQTPHVFGSEREQLWGFGPLGLQLWNSIRVIDFLESLGEVDKARIAVTGASGGGTQTFLVAAVDERVAVAAPVNMVSAIMQGGCRCENAPGLRWETFNVEIAAMMAPRPMLLVASTQDWTRNTLEEEYPAIRKIYALYDAEDKVAAVRIDAPHNYNRDSREAVYRFFARHLAGRGDVEEIREERVPIEQLSDLMVFHGRPLPDGAVSYEQLFRSWQEAARRQNEAAKDPAVLRERLELAVKAEWPARVISYAGEGRRIYLSRPEVQDRVPALWFGGKGAPALVVHPEGAEAGRASPAGKRLLEAGRPVLFLDAFQTGAAVAPRDRSHPHFLTFNLSDDAHRVQDILTGLAYLTQHERGRPELAGIGKAAVWSLFAAALAPVEVDLGVEPSGFAGTDEEFAAQFFVPGIQRAGGLEAARKLLARGSSR